ncbi:hypothetical protein C9374_010973 [Naegleria lovaniensis]|uniref:Uncharacterized protein n=1 Tax=Naegleria lovaniensis TaxID=51637 RepID=A0AA88KDS9_NAELO|nr:uncharacterized protein C9374_010973 [Naegleria lovaniensis]KAG2374403.1 hypothetical protein C9374_010973 [Naegleria lovaniensis]
MSKRTHEGTNSTTVRDRHSEVYLVTIEDETDEELVDEEETDSEEFTPISKKVKIVSDHIDLPPHANTITASSSPSTNPSTNPIFEKLKEMDSSINFKTKKDFEEAFASIAHYLLNHVELVAKGKTFRLAELEFYYTCAPVHNDPFNHCHALQTTKGEWYFHQSPSKLNNDNYRGGNYKGLDLSIGCAKFKGGILIRSLIRCSDNKFIEGPSLCVDEILSLYSCNTIHEFVMKHFPNQKHFNALDEKSTVHLRVCATPKSDSFIRSARVGLTLKQQRSKKERIEFIFRPYRFCLRPEKVKKGKHLMAIVLYKELWTKGEKDIIKKVEKLIGTSGLAKYFEVFEEKKAIAFESVSKIDAKTVKNYDKDLTTQQIYELGGILRHIF